MFYIVKREFCEILELTKDRSSYKLVVATIIQIVCMGTYAQPTGAPRCPGGALWSHRHLGAYSLVDTPTFTTGWHYPLI